MTGVAPYAATANALKASGVIVRMEPDAFLGIVGRAESPLVVVAHGGFFRKRYRYLTSVRGLAFYTESEAPLALPRADVIAAKNISIPEVYS